MIIGKYDKGMVESITEENLALIRETRELNESLQHIKQCSNFVLAEQVGHYLYGVKPSKDNEIILIFVQKPPKEDGYTYVRAVNMFNAEQKAVLWYTRRKDRTVFNLKEHLYLPELKSWGDYSKGYGSAAMLPLIEEANMFNYPIYAELSHFDLHNHKRSKPFYKKHGFHIEMDKRGTSGDMVYYPPSYGTPSE